jgi:murein DD-endopeptidase MepM/ murein hydrolase activator NlpD
MTGRRLRGCSRRASLALVLPVLVVALLARGSEAETASAPRDRPDPAARRVHAASTSGLGHTVRSGDTLWSIARRYGVSVDALARANGLRPKERLRVGQHLVIPGSAVEEGRQEPPSLAAIVLGAPPTSEPSTLSWPVVGPIASPFGPRGSAWHGGIDIRAEQGTVIRAAAAGIVVTSDHERAYGHVVKIWHARDLMTVYAHNLENLVKVGDWVERGQAIGVVGKTGRATAPHLHFEVRLDGKKYDPLYWLPPPGAFDVATARTPSPARVP